MIRDILSVFKDLNANTDPGDLAHAASCALLLAFIPRNNLLWPLLFLLMCFIRMHKTVFLLCLIAFSFLTPRLDAFTDALGFRLLTLEAAQGFYEALYQIPFVGWTRFNNTMVAGGFLLGVLCYIPLYAAVRLLLRLYREKIGPKIGGVKLASALGRLPLINRIVSFLGNEKK